MHGITSQYSILTVGAICFKILRFYVFIMKVSCVLRTQGQSVVEFNLGERDRPLEQATWYKNACPVHTPKKQAQVVFPEIPSSRDLLSIKRNVASISEDFQKKIIESMDRAVQ